jgi:aquaporin Z
MRQTSNPHLLAHAVGRRQTRRFGGVNIQNSARPIALRPGFWKLGCRATPSSDESTGPNPAISHDPGAKTDRPGHLPRAESAATFAAIITHDLHNFLWEGELQKSLAEFVGTFALVFFGCGAAVIGGMGSGATAVDLLGIAAAFGLSIVAMAYGIGPISGCHINPAVSFGVYVAGRMTLADMISYWVAQVLGAIAAAVVLYVILSGKAQGWTGGLGQNGWGPGYLGEYSLLSAFVFEVVGTFLFLVCILGVTQEGSPSQFAGLAIGLTLIAIHLVGINVTGTSVNPARSIGPALIGIATNGKAVAQLWLFIIAPLIGAGIAGVLFRAGTGALSADKA